MTRISTFGHVPQRPGCLTHQQGQYDTNASLVQAGPVAQGGGVAAGGVCGGCFGQQFARHRPPAAPVVLAKPSRKQVWRGLQITVQAAKGFGWKMYPLGLTSSPVRLLTIQPAQLSWSAPISPSRRNRSIRTTNHGTRQRPASQWRTVRSETPRKAAQDLGVRKQLCRSSRKPSGLTIQTRRRRGRRASREGYQQSRLEGIRERSAGSHWALLKFRIMYIMSNLCKLSKCACMILARLLRPRLHRMNATKKLRPDRPKLRLFG